MTNDVFLCVFRGKLSDMSLFSQAFQSAVTENVDVDVEQHVEAKEPDVFSAVILKLGQQNQGKHRRQATPALSGTLGVLLPARCSISEVLSYVPCLQVFLLHIYSELCNQ